MCIINLTQHNATNDQREAGVVEPADKVAVKQLLTFEKLPTAVEIRTRAATLAEMAKAFPSAMIGGAPFLMGPLEAALKEVGVQPVYSFTQRESSEEPDGQGGVRKTQVFRHVGFVAID